jgi:hypothetical protein
MNVNQARTETETTRDSHPIGVTEHDDHHLPRKKDAKRTIMVVCAFVVALAMLIGLNMK